MSETYAGPASASHRDEVTRDERRRWRDSVERMLAEREAATRYEQRQREVRSGRTAREERSGSRDAPRVLARVRRLING
jgi:hypothetical protein